MMADDKSEEDAKTVGDTTPRIMTDDEQMAFSAARRKEMQRRMNDPRGPGELGGPVDYRNYHGQP
jgi:hypothetical protein